MKIQKLFLAAVGILLISPAALFAGGGRDSGAPSDSQGAVNADISTLAGWGAATKARFNGQTITVAMAAHPSTDAFRSMEREFTNLTGIKVVWDVVEETSLKNKQLLDVQSAGSYDVMMVDAFWMSEYASKNVLDPIQSFTDDPAKTPPWFDYNDIMPAYRNGIAGANGVNYGIPTAG
ncbi:MAG: extracellular solute-binding protein, partial [Spirochaetaceae bacterium]|nr:extracellular solute-binding protein [Spirochaetaceae bacterium]